MLYTVRWTDKSGTLAWLFSDWQNAENFAAGRSYVHGYAELITPAGTVTKYKDGKKVVEN